MLQDISLFYQNGQIVSDDDVTISPSLLPTATGTLLAVSSYAPASQTSYAQTGTTSPTASLAAFSSTNINTGSFTAPTSGNVLVEVTCVIKASAAAAVNVVGLCEHGGVTPVLGNTVSFQCGAANDSNAYTFAFLVTGLTSGDSYNFDLVGACYTNADTFTILAYGQANTQPTGSAGAPVIMKVTAL